MDLESFCPFFQRVLLGTEKPKRVETAARQIAGFFHVQAHEVGLFQLDSAGRTAVFRWPPHQPEGSLKIPIKSFAAALVSTTARNRHGTINNAFASTSHLKMFELALTDKDHRQPVQKIMSASGSDGETLKWIVQVSRKGHSLEDAGPDFTEADLQQLEVIATCMASCDL